MRISNELFTTDAEVAVGDLLRCRSNGWEGQVIDLNEEDQWVTLAMNDGSQQALHPADLFFNGWDPKVLP